MLISGVSPPRWGAMSVQPGLSEAKSGGSSIVAPGPRVTLRSTRATALSLLDQPGLLDHRPPGLGLPLDERPELLWAERLGRHALLPHALAHLGLGHDVGDLAIDLAHD